MKLLLDTHILLWAAGQPELLPLKAQVMLNDERNELFFSAASLWEITIKNSLQHPDFNVNAGLLRRGLNDNGYQELAISGAHAIAVSALPSIHKDPFDRILIAQAIAEGMTLVTMDLLVARYTGPIHFFS